MRFLLFSSKIMYILLPDLGRVLSLHSNLQSLLGITIKLWTPIGFFIKAVAFRLPPATYAKTPAVASFARNTQWYFSNRVHLDFVTFLVVKIPNFSFLFAKCSCKCNFDARLTPSAVACLATGWPDKFWIVYCAKLQSPSSKLDEVGFA